MIGKIKSDAMVKRNKKCNLEKENIALGVIRLYLEKGIPLSVSNLAEETGYSMSFFYKNPRVREALEKGKESSSKNVDANTETTLKLDYEALLEMYDELVEENKQLKIKENTYKYRIHKLEDENKKLMTQLANRIIEEEF